MDEPYKEVFTLRVFGELSFGEISQLFEKPRAGLESPSLEPSKNSKPVQGGESTMSRVSCEVIQDLLYYDDVAKTPRPW